MKHLQALLRRISESDRVVRVIPLLVIAVFAVNISVATIYLYNNWWLKAYHSDVVDLTYPRTLAITKAPDEEGVQIGKLRIVEYASVATATPPQSAVRKYGPNNFTDITPQSTEAPATVRTLSLSGVRTTIIVSYPISEENTVATILASVGLHEPTELHPHDHSH